MVPHILSTVFSSCGLESPELQCRFIMPNIALTGATFSHFGISKFCKSASYQTKEKPKQVNLTDRKFKLWWRKQFHQKLRSVQIEAGA
ncbi:hypothetical protein Nepgr_011884 [Nepenthes gracilis]|uniref:Uncharacterized protein n=1 Tax=Nepenthes gracilis TaxID=150966 RepID=A0AAD3SF36_NEPGR|nr:hypothetical protein Nepgr_011884 [Nepenthes gracilis]